MAVGTERDASRPRTVRLAIPAIKLDAEVKQGGIVQDAGGNPVWQTLPFVAVHYGDLGKWIYPPDKTLGQRPGDVWKVNHPVAQLSTAPAYYFSERGTTDNSRPPWMVSEPASRSCASALGWRRIL